MALPLNCRPRSRLARSIRVHCIWDPFLPVCLTGATGDVRGYRDGVLIDASRQAPSGFATMYHPDIAVADHPAG